MFTGTVRYEGGKERSRGFFLNTGVSAYLPPNRGVFEQTNRPEDVGKFRVPSPRNVAVTARYMHDRSIATLEDAIDHYAAGGRMDHPNKSPILKKFSLTPQERKDLVEFLKSLTDEEMLHDARWTNPWAETDRR